MRDFFRLGFSGVLAAAIGIIAGSIVIKKYSLQPRHVSLMLIGSAVAFGAAHFIALLLDCDQVHLHENWDAKMYVQRNVPELRRYLSWDRGVPMASKELQIGALFSGRRREMVISDRAIKRVRFPAMKIFFLFSVFSFSSFWSLKNRKKPDQTINYSYWLFSSESINFASRSFEVISIALSKSTFQPCFWKIRNFFKIFAYYKKRH